MPPVYTIPRTKACQGCAAAKVRCEPGVDYARCKRYICVPMTLLYLDTHMYFRCNVLDVGCVVHQAVPRKRRKTQSPSATTASITIVGDSMFGSKNAGSCSLFEIERGMHYYRTSLFDFFPFIIMPDVKQSAASFAEVKPFLSLVVAMLGCTKDRARQRELFAAAKAHVAAYMIQNGHKTLDILQGLLAMVSW